MTGAMYAAIAGLRTHMSKMNVIGNNIANVNTAGYKTQRTLFQDAMYSMYSGGSNGTTTTGGRNPAQIGYGSQISSIDINMTTGTFTPGRPTDCMVVGDGFLMVGDKNLATVIDPNNPESLKSLKLTRVGDLEFKADGYLCDGRGNPVYGFLTTGVDQNGKPIVSDQLVPIRLPKMEVAYYQPDGAPGTQADYEAATPEIKKTWTVKTEIRYPVDKDAQNNNANIPLHDYEKRDQNGNLIALPNAELDGISINPKTGAITGTVKGADLEITIGFVAVGNVTNPNGVTHDEGYYYTAGEGCGDLTVSLIGGVGKDLGIERVNASLYRPGANNTPQSDKMVIGDAGETRIMPGGLEGSNVELAAEISEMITTQRGYQANTRIITVTDTMLEELVNMKR